MDSTNNVVDVEEAFEHLGFASKAKSRLKTSIDMEKLLTNKSATFEVEVDDIRDELALEDDDEGMEGLDIKSYISSRVRNVPLIPTTLEQALAGTDFMSGPFSEIESSMISIHANSLVKKQVITPGNGRKVPEDGKVFVNYIAICEGADEPFDSTILRKSPSIFDMRKADALPGLFCALLSMELMELSKFIVDSSLGYGELGCPPRVPAKANILFIVEVLRIVDQEMLESPLFMTAEERAVLPFEKIHATSEQLRNEGNGFYTDKNYWPAVKKYRKAANILEDYPLVGSSDEASRSNLLHTIYANLAQCYLSLDRPAQACSACKLGLRSASGKDNVKLLYRFAQAKLKLKDCDSAIDLCDRALRLESNNTTVKTLKRQAQEEQVKQAAASKRMFQNMLK